MSEPPEGTGTIDCPFCAEPIQPQARRCKHCQEPLDPGRPPRRRPGRRVRRYVREGPLGDLSIGFGVFALSLLLCFWPASAALGLVALVLGLLAATNPTTRRKGLAGILLGALALVVGPVVFLIVVVGLP